MHPVVKARQPFGLFLDILDFKCVAVDGQDRTDDPDPMYMRFDSHGRIFRKCKDTNGCWERIPYDEISKWFHGLKPGS